VPASGDWLAEAKRGRLGAPREKETPPAMAGSLPQAGRPGRAVALVSATCASCLASILYAPQANPRLPKQDRAGRPWKSPRQGGC
jgi:hypothetical protein